jgi:hypothetical protein
MKRSQGTLPLPQDHTYQCSWTLVLGAWSVAWRGRKLELVYGRAHCRTATWKMELGIRKYIVPFCTHGARVARVHTVGLDAPSSEDV